MVARDRSQKFIVWSLYLMIAAVLLFAVLAWQVPAGSAGGGSGGGGPTPQELYCYWEYYQWGPPCYYCCSGTSCSLVCCDLIWPGCQTWPCYC